MLKLSPHPGVVDLCAVAATPPIAKILYDRQSAAFALSISVRALDYQIAAKQLQFRKAGKKILIPHSSLVRWASANHPSLTPEPPKDLGM
jgi:hypothetical protein